MFSHCFTVSALWTLVTGSCSGKGTSCPWSSCQTYESDSASRSSSHNSLRNAKIRWYMVIQRIFVDLFDMALWNPLTLTNHTEPDTPPTVCKIRLWCTTNHHTISLSQPCKDINSIRLTFFHLSPSMLQPALWPFHQEPFGHSRGPSRSSRPSEPATMGLWHPQALWTSSQHSQLWSKLEIGHSMFPERNHFYAAIIPATALDGQTWPAAKLRLVWQSQGPLQVHELWEEELLLWTLAASRASSILEESSRRSSEVWGREREPVRSSSQTLSNAKRYDWNLQTHRVKVKLAYHGIFFQVSHAPLKPIHQSLTFTTWSSLLCKSITSGKLSPRTWRKTWFCRAKETDRQRERESYLGRKNTQVGTSRHKPGLRVCTSPQHHLQVRMTCGPVLQCFTCPHVWICLASFDCTAVTFRWSMQSYRC